jgi:hypothetical protein
MRFAAGDWVEVRSKAEILATLDEDGRLEGLPFMPEMLRFCGGQFRVFKRAGKTCSEAVGPAGLAFVSRELKDAVHLDHRCDGSAHGGCQAGCLMFWKEAWLRPIGRHASSAAIAVSKRSATGHRAGRCKEDRIYAAAASRGADNEARYICQATQLMEATTPLKLWNLRQYFEAVRSGNDSVAAVLKALVYVAYYYATLARSPRLGAPARWFYDLFQSVWGGLPFPRKAGTIGPGQPHPRLDLGLQPGDVVRVKPYRDILETINGAATNRGLSFDAELVPYCGKVFTVRTRIERFVDEKTGRMRKMKTPAVILDGVYCQSLYSGQRILCPRAVFLWWREIWLERISESGAAPSAAGLACGSCHSVTARRVF